MENPEEILHSSEGHNPGSRDENQQQADKPVSDSPATAGTDHRDEDAADPGMAKNDTSKGFDSDQQAIDAGLNDGDLDTDVPEARARGINA